MMKDKIAKTTSASPSKKPNILGDNKKAVKIVEYPRGFKAGVGGVSNAMKTHR